MVLAVKNSLVDVNGARLKSGPSHRAMAPAAVEAARKGLLKGNDTVAAKRARLMVLAKMAVHVSERIPQGAGFFVMDPDALERGERLICPFKVKTLCVNPEDIDKAIKHFSGGKEAAQAQISGAAAE